jgi:hypothetical protein
MSLYTLSGCNKKTPTQCGRNELILGGVKPYCELLGTNIKLKLI